jgi:hypothetical protein
MINVVLKCPLGVAVQVSPGGCSTNQSLAVNATTQSFPIASTMEVQCREQTICLNRFNHAVFNTIDLHFIKYTTRHQIGLMYAAAFEGLVPENFTSGFKYTDLN